MQGEHYRRAFVFRTHTQATVAAAVAAPVALISFRAACCGHAIIYQKQAYTHARAVAGTACARLTDCAASARSVSTFSLGRSRCASSAIAFNRKLGTSTLESSGVFVRGDVWWSDSQRSIAARSYVCPVIHQTDPEHKNAEREHAATHQQSEVQISQPYSWVVKSRRIKTPSNHSVRREVAHRPSPPPGPSRSRQ